MNIYHISQKSNRDYDTYDSAVVIANTESEARRIDPGSEQREKVRYLEDIPAEDYFHTWVRDPDKVSCTLIGETTLYTVPCVICASFNAG